MIKEKDNTLIVLINGKEINFQNMIPGFIEVNELNVIEENLKFAFLVSKILKKNVFVKISDNLNPILKLIRNTSIPDDAKAILFNSLLIILQPQV